MKVMTVQSGVFHIMQGTPIFYGPAGFSLSETFRGFIKFQLQTNIAHACGNRVRFKGPAAPELPHHP